VYHEVAGLDLRSVKGVEGSVLREEMGLVIPVMTDELVDPEGPLENLTLDSSVPLQLLTRG